MNHSLGFAFWLRSLSEYTIFVLGLVTLAFVTHNIEVAKL